MGTDEACASTKCGSLNLEDLLKRRLPPAGLFSVEWVLFILKILLLRFGGFRSDVEPALG